MDDNKFIAEVQNTIIRKREKVGFDGLTEKEKIVELVSSLDFEVTMSGLCIYYENSSGDYAIDVVNALEAIGVREASEIIKKANSIFPNGTPSRNRSTRVKELRNLGEKGESILDDLTSELYKTIELSPFIGRFILNHKEDFSELDLSGAEKSIKPKKFIPSELLYSDISKKIHKGMHISQLQEIIGNDIPIVGLTTRASDTISFLMRLKDVDVKLVTDKNERLISWETMPK